MKNSRTILPAIVEVKAGRRQYFGGKMEAARSEETELTLELYASAMDVGTDSGAACHLRGLTDVV